MEELRQKYQKQVEELNDQLDAQKRNKQNIDKARDALVQENKNLDQELKSVQAAKTESEKRRKQAELTVTELSARLSDADNGRAALVQQLDRVSPCKPRPREHVPPSTTVDLASK